MLIDARSVAEDAVVRADICIIGAGAAGISIAHALRGRGVSVAVLESGSFLPGRATQALYRGRNTGREYFPLDGCRVRTFGGSTQRWGGWCRSLDAGDFEAREWVPCSGWPIAREELSGYYQRARELCQLVATEDEIDRGPPIPRRPRLAVRDRRLATVVYQFSPPTRFGQTYRPALQRADDVAVYLWANVVGFDGGAHGSPLTAARVRTLAGGHFRVEARVFILAAGGIENPRILLASDTERPGGLGNEHDLVGRFFMEHLHVRLGCFVPRDGTANLSLYVEGRRSVLRPLGALTVAPSEREGRRLYGFSAAFFPPSRRSPEQLLRHQAARHRPWGLHAASIARAGVVGFGLRVIDKAVRDARESGGMAWYRLPMRPGHRIYEIMARGEQTPRRDSRVTLGRARDALGLPIPELDWRIDPCDLVSMTTSLEVLAAVVAEHGVGTIHLPVDPEYRWADRVTGSWHHMGTTRMHEDPRQGVVDATGRVHTVPNLYVTGSSVFPTGGYANPTLTIIALALRLADHVERVVNRPAVHLR